MNDRQVQNKVTLTYLEIASCTIEGCSRGGRRIKGFCQKHYDAQYTANPETRAKRRAYQREYSADANNKAKKAKSQIEYNAKAGSKLKKATREAKPINRFKQAIRDAKRRGLEWDIVFEAYEPMVQEPCYYCGGALNRTGSGLDRLDNTKGYLKSNVVACCRICNRIKGQQWSVEEMQAAMTAVREVRYKNRIVDSKQTGESV